MEWKHIREVQPKDGESIIQCDEPYNGHYTIGMRDYYQKCSFEDLLKYEKDRGYTTLNWWWISAKDFPFPDQPERLNPEAPKGDAIVRTPDINKTGESSRND